MDSSGQSVFSRLPLMSNRKLFTFLGSILFSIPVLMLLFIFVWFQTQFVQLEDWDDTFLLSQSWQIGEGLNGCRLDITQKKRLSSFAESNYIWDRVPNAWQKGIDANQVTQPKRVPDKVYAGFITNTERVFVNDRDPGRETIVLTKNSLNFLIHPTLCKLFK